MKDAAGLSISVGGDTAWKENQGSENWLLWRRMVMRKLWPKSLNASFQLSRNIAVN